MIPVLRVDHHHSIRQDSPEDYASLPSVPSLTSHHCALLAVALINVSLSLVLLSLVQNLSLQHFSFVSPHRNPYYVPENWFTARGFYSSFGGGSTEPFTSGEEDGGNTYGVGFEGKICVSRPSIPSSKRLKHCRISPPHATDSTPEYQWMTFVMDYRRRNTV
jgi:hypothetical protein